MASQISLMIRALSDKKGGVVIRNDRFLLVNTNVIEDGEITGVAALDFQGDEIPSEQDLTHDLIVVGSWGKHNGREQFAVKVWSYADDSPSQLAVRYKSTKKLSSKEMKRLLDDEDSDK